MKILHLLNYAGKGGTEKYIYNLIENMQVKDAQIFLAYHVHGPLVDNVAKLGVKTFQIKMSNPFDVMAAWQLAKLCKDLSIDIIHTHYLRENYIALLSKLLNPKIKVLYTNHIINKDTKKIVLFNKLFTKGQDKIIAISNKAKEILIENGHDKNKIEIVYHGVKLNRCELKKKDITDSFTLFCGSRFTKEKGHLFLIQSINELRKKTNMKFKCILANDGPMLEECKSLVKSLYLEDTITFIGFVDDINSIYRGIDIYINPSKEEALGLANLEVLALGIPLIATDVGGVKDIINETTNCGILVQYGDMDQMAQAIIKVINDDVLRNTLSNNALNTIKTTFSLEGMLEKTNIIYKGMI